MYIIGLYDNSTKESYEVLVSDSKELSETISFTLSKSDLEIIGVELRFILVGLNSLRETLKS